MSHVFLAVEPLSYNHFPQKVGDQVKLVRTNTWKTVVIVVNMHPIFPLSH